MQSQAQKQFRISDNKFLGLNRDCNTIISLRLYNGSFNNLPREDMAIDFNMLKLIV